MRKEVKFQTEEFVPDWVSDYSEKKFTVFNTCFLSTKKNSHELDISEEVLRKDAQSILGNFLVAKLQYGDATTHLSDEIIYGYFPKEQEIVFEEEEIDGEKIVKAKAFCVISKMYGQEFNDIFSYNNLRNTSVEMTVETEKNNENKVVGFDIYGLTCLGMAVKGSCPDANMKMIRFSEEEANAFFNKVHKNSLTALEQFAESRKKLMAESKSYKIDKSKEAMSNKAWGDIDKTELRNKIMEAKNRSTLVKAVYMLVEDGWEEAPSEHLKYPAMCFEGDTLVYNKGGLASALGYAKKEEETAVVNKINKIYKNLGLDQDGKEDDAKMAEVNFEIEGRKAWADVIKKVQDHEGDGAYVDSIEDNHIIYTKGDVRYRVEADVKVDKDDKSVDADIKWDTVKKDADQKMSEDEAKCEDKEEKKMSDDCDCKDDDHDDEEDFAKKCAEMEKKIEERDNIIMEKDRELEELREFKRGVEEKEKMMAVEAILSEVEEFMSEDSIKSLREEGKALSKDQIDAFANKVKAQAFEFSANTKKNKKTDVWSFAAPNNFKENKSKSVWDRI